MHQFTRRRFNASMLLSWGATMLAIPEVVSAQAAYPQKSITMLLGFPPGGSTDFIARLVGQKLTDALGQPVVVENRPGANGLLAAGIATATPPDGYTLLLTSMGLTTNPYLYTRNKLDPNKNFTAISMVANVANVLVTSPAVPAKDLRELLALARSRSNPMTQATTGQAAPGHLAGELLQRAAKVKFENVAYKGSGPALTDLMAGHVDMSMPTVVAALPFIKSGKLRAHAVTGAKRSSLLPEVPTFGEAGFPELGAGSGWYGLVGPAGIPKDIAEKLNSEVTKLMRVPEVRERFIANGADPITSSTAEMSSFLAQDYKRWGELIKATNIKAED